MRWGCRQTVSTPSPAPTTAPYAGGASRRVSASLFSPGYSIASVIANELTEATSNLHYESLIELGLVLFILTFILNGLARLLIVATSQRGGGMGHA